MSEPWGQGPDTVQPSVKWWSSVDGAPKPVVDSRPNRCHCPRHRCSGHLSRQAFLGLVPWPTSLAFPWVLAARCVSVLALACGVATGVLGLAALAAGVLLVAPLALLEPVVLAVAVAAGACVAAADAGVFGAAAVVVLLDLAAAWPGVGALFAVLAAATVGVGVVPAPVLGVAVVAANPRPANVDRVNAVMMSLFMLSP